jgi:hypothetical protein
MISEPYFVDDRHKWVVQTDNGILEYETSIEAYESYRRLKAFQERMDGKEWVAPTTPLSKPTTPLVRGVESGPLPANPFYYPFNSAEEYVRALESDNKRLTLELENKELQAGTISWRVILLKVLGDGWIKLLLAGVGSGLVGWLLKGVLS